MATPSKKSPQVERMLNRFTNRDEAIRADRCVNPPIGCGQPATEFRDDLSHKEFTISGLCQHCQDKIWG